MSVHTKILVPLCIDTWVHAGGEGMVGLKGCSARRRTVVSVCN